MSSSSLITMLGLSGMLYIPNTKSTKKQEDYKPKILFEQTGWINLPLLPDIYQLLNTEFNL